jgi:hypothetical protein
MRQVRKVLPATKSYRKERFFVTEHGRRLVTPLFVVLVLVELDSTDGFVLCLEVETQEGAKFRRPRE